MQNLIKTCPKCHTEHVKPGMYCSRHCANSRTSTEETNKKRSISCKISGKNFWDNNPKAAELRAARKKTYFCKKCNTNEVLKNNRICQDCKPVRNKKTQCQKNKNQRNKQVLINDGNLPKSSIVTIPEFGIPGKGATLEKELERRRKIKEKAKLNNGGYRKGSGRGKKGWYKGIFCDSSWELAFVLWCELHKINLERNQQKFNYCYNNKVYKYLPDFIINGNFIEIKGYLSPQNIEKIKQFPHDLYKLEVYTEKELMPILKLVTRLYGKDYTRLYEHEESESDKRTDLVLKTSGAPEGFAGQD